jgi:uncharacterized protein YchJ
MQRVVEASKQRIVEMEAAFAAQLQSERARFVKELAEMYYIQSSSSSSQQSDHCVIV